MLSIAELGILRDVRIDGHRVVATITPTYSGCPAMRQIEDDLRSALGAAGFDDVDVVMEHEPPWSSDRITPEGLEKLTAFGIAPPRRDRLPEVPIGVAPARLQVRVHRLQGTHGLPLVR